MAKYTPRYAKKKSIWKVFPLFCGFALVLTVLLVLGSMSSGSSAKYVHETQAEGLLISEKFFFSSDLLANYEKDPITLNSTATSFTFTLQNYEGEGDAKRTSEIPVHYQVSVTGNSDAPAAINDPTGTLDTTSGPVTITVSGGQAGNTYVITAEGYTREGNTPAGYIETLTATVEVAPAKTGFYKNTINEPEYVLLTVWSENQEGTLTVSVPSGLIPDPSYVVITNYSGTNYGAFDFPVTLGTYASRQYRFFKTAGSGNVSITVKANGHTVSEAPLQ